MCNPRRIRVEATRQLVEAWSHEVRRQVTLHGEAVGRAEVRQPLGSMLGAPVLATLERVLQDHEGWREVPEGFRLDLEGGYVVYHADTRELETVAELRTQVSAEQEATTSVGGVVTETLHVEGEGRYYDDSWGGYTEQTARRDAEQDARRRLADAEQDARRRLADAAAERLARARQEAEAAAQEETEARARAAAEEALSRARSAAQADLDRAAAERLEVIGARAQEALNGVLALAYRDAILAYARSRRAAGLEVSEADGVLRIEFEMEG
jgi:hypothetical protein